MAEPSDAPPYRYTAAVAARIEAAWQDRWEREGTFAPPIRRVRWRTGSSGSPNPHRFPPGYVPVPERRRAARRPPARLHRHRRLRPVPADARVQRPAHDGVRRLRPAGGAARGRDRKAPALDHRGQHPDLPPSAAPARPRARPATALATTDPGSTAGRSGSSSRSSAPVRPGRGPGPAGRGTGGRAGRGTRAPATGTTRSDGRGRSCGRAAAGGRRTPAGVPGGRGREWCPGLGTVLANEEVTSDGRSERGGFPVYRRPLTQWMLRITAFAERLLAAWTGRLAGARQAPAAELDRPV